MFRREDARSLDGFPTITFEAGHFRFNATFSKNAHLEPGDHVLIDPQDNEFTIRFQFKSTPTLGASFPIEQQQGKNSYRCTLAKQLERDHPWIADAVKERKSIHRRFVANKKGDSWVIEVGPAFGDAVARQNFKVSPTESGIYQYLDGEEIVYIGIGHIGRQFRITSREHWQFSHVKYASVPEADQRQKWESVLLKRFRQRNNGKLPRYNKNGGMGQADSDS